MYSCVAMVFTLSVVILASSAAYAAPQISEPVACDRCGGCGGDDQGDCFWCDARHEHSYLQRDDGDGDREFK